MKKLWASLILIMTGMVLYGQGVDEKSDELKQEIKNVLTDYQRAWEYNFTAQMKSNKIKERLEEEISNLASVPVRIKKMLFIYDGKGRLEVELGSLPRKLKENLETRVKEVIERSDINAICQNLTYLMLRQTIDILLAQESFDITNINNKALDFEVNDLDIPFIQQKNVESVRIWIDRKKKFVDQINFNFKDDQYITIKFKYKLLNIPKKNVQIYFHDKLDIEQNALLKKGDAALDFPKKFDIKYSDFIFDK